MKKKIALVFGVTGQDGSYLSSFLIKKGYLVHGVKRRSSSLNTSRIDHIYQDPFEKNRNFFLHYGDVTDAISVSSLIKKIKPSEIYNLAAQSHVSVSFEVPEYTANADAIGALRILEAIKFHGFQKITKFYQAGTSEMYGKVREIPQSEKTPFYPRSPYGVAKLFSHWMVVNYRESYGLYCSSGILFNHESEYRGAEFVTQKIIKKVVSISMGDKIPLVLGNIDAERDWGYAKDYVEGMYLMLQQDKADDFVLATNSKISVRRFIEIAFKHVGINISWNGEGLNEKGIDSSTNRTILEISEEFYRPAEVDQLIGDYTKAKDTLGWEPTTSLEELVKIMIDHCKKSF